jgi:hypothetical protein
MFNQEQLKDILDYNHETGIFTWKKKIARKNNIGAIAGTIKDGYIIVRIYGKQYRAHRLAFLYMEGYFPDKIDHIDTNRANNKWSNLRKATQSQNLYNSPKRSDNTSGIKGVDFKKKLNKWQVRINVNKERFYLGVYSSKEEAEKVARDFREKHPKEFANHG